MADKIPYKEGDLIFDRLSGSVFKYQGSDFPTLRDYPKNFRPATSSELAFLKSQGKETGKISIDESELTKLFMVMVADGIDTEPHSGVIYVSPIKWQYLSGKGWTNRADAESEIVCHQFTRSCLVKIEEPFLYSKK